MANKKNKTVPSKCIITMGAMLSQTKYTGKVSSVDMLNALIILMKDTQEVSGMQYKEIFAIVDEGLGCGVFRSKPTMRASVSDDVSGND